MTNEQTAVLLQGWLDALRAAIRDDNQQGTLDAIHAYCGYIQRQIDLLQGNIEIGMVGEPCPKCREVE